MHICFKVNSSLEGTIIVKLDTLFFHGIPPANFAEFIEKSDHIEMPCILNKYFSFSCNGCHGEGGSFNAVRNNRVFDFIKTPCSLNADGPIDIQGDLSAEFLQKENKIHYFWFKCCISYFCYPS